MLRRKAPRHEGTLNRGSSAMIASDHNASTLRRHLPAKSSLRLETGLRLQDMARFEKSPCFDLVTESFG
tara:strand:- start:282 stop:488 length:207 start_codon:yes stop_codon:yes gene_type:complete